MKFDCKHIDISNEDFGCTLTFQDRKDSEYQGDQTVQEIMDSLGNYIMLQRTYSEGIGDMDYCYCEMNEIGYSGELKDFQIDFKKNKFSMIYKSKIIEINLTISDAEFKEIEDALIIITRNKGSLNIIK